jgi:hypothetical protein
MLQQTLWSPIFFAEASLSRFCSLLRPPMTNFKLMADGGDTRENK